MQITHIHVLGGARGIGRWFVDYVFSRGELDVTIYDIDIPSNPPLNPRVKAVNISYTDEGVVGVPDFGQSDAVVIAVPMEVLDNTCHHLFPHVSDDGLVVDMSSIKVPSHRIIRKNSGNRFSVLGAHPLFGPLVSSPVGQTVVLTDFDTNNPKHSWFEKLLKANGFLVPNTTPELHDDYMLFVQVLTHFVLLIFGKVLADSQNVLSHLLKFKTPPFSFLSAFTGRLLGGNAQTYANIQTLEDAEHIRHAAIEAAKELNRIFDSKEDLKNAVKTIQTIARPFTSAEIAECRALSAVATDSIQELEKRLFDLCQRRAMCGLQRIDIDKVHVGIVLEIRSDRILFQDRTKRITLNGRDMHIVCTTDENVKKMKM